MKKTFFSLLCALTLPFFITGTVAAADPTDSGPLPVFTLVTPDNSEHIEYLGLKWGPGTPFRSSDIDADILMIELFSMYCPYCQKAAPNVNALYALMEKNKQPDLKMVLIGIGANNTPLEVETFRQGYDIEFPLFSDKDLTIYKALKGEGTPTFIAAKKDGDDWVIFLKKAGGFADPPEFFQTILNTSGLQR